uniref:Serine hydrolase like 2 n=1 Tax=Pongo abelii TaxID=9601 RepID=H2P4M4_PONAB
MAENAAPGLISELKLAVPWGHIAAKAWGSLQGPPVLCLHGWLDNANSFDRLIPLLLPDFYYVAMDFGGHGLSSHYSPGVPYNLQTFVSEIRRVVAGKKQSVYFSAVWGFSCTFPEMVDKLTLLDTLLFPLESNEMENLLTYKRRAIEHMLQIEASQEPSHVFSLKQLLQRLLKSNSHLSEECGELLLQRGTKKVNSPFLCLQPENSADYVSRELCAHSIRKLQAHVLFIKAVHGYFESRDNYSEEESVSFMIDMMKSTLKERFQFVEVPGNHCVHMCEPQHVASIISSFLQRTHTLPAQL